MKLLEPQPNLMVWNDAGQLPTTEKPGMLSSLAELGELDEHPEAEESS